MLKARFQIISWHGENRTLFYIVDNLCPTLQVPNIIHTCKTRIAAEKFKLKMEKKQNVKLQNVG